MSAIALSISLFSVAGFLVAEELPGEESPDIPSEFSDSDAVPDTPVLMAPEDTRAAASAIPGVLPAPLPDPEQSNGSGPVLGPVTNLPLPRFLSMKTERTNVRRGPSKTHRIDWEFLRRGMPVEVVAEYGHWRRIRDHDGMGGWVHYALISGHRTVLVEQDMLELRFRPDSDSRITAKLEAGVIADLDECTLDWCKVSVAGYKGWAPKTALWGVMADEIRE
jgi:SH3-like domain-containing protein